MSQTFSPFAQHASTQDIVDGHVKRGAAIGGHPTTRLSVTASQASDPGTPHEIRINVQSDGGTAPADVGAVYTWATDTPQVFDVRHTPATMRHHFAFRDYSLKAGKDATDFIVVVEA